MRRFMKNNKGYSLVEMIIVIAIIAVLTSAALVTITLINSAKAKEAGVTLDSEISRLVAQSKSQMPIFDDGSGTKAEHKDYNFAIAIYKNTDKKYYIASGYYNKQDNKFSTFDVSNNNGGKGICLSSKVSVSYEPGNKNTSNSPDCDINGTTYSAWVVSFDKAGRCICGVGTFELKKSSDNTVIDEISIKANGSHQAK